MVSEQGREVPNRSGPELDAGRERHHRWTANRSDRGASVDQRTHHGRICWQSICDAVLYQHRALAHSDWELPALVLRPSEAEIKQLVTGDHPRCTTSDIAILNIDIAI